jgi:hypothetical protein
MTISTTIFLIIFTIVEGIAMLNFKSMIELVQKNVSWTNVERDVTVILPVALMIFFWPVTFFIFWLMKKYANYQGKRK